MMFQALRRACHRPPSTDKIRQRWSSYRNKADESIRERSLELAYLAQSGQPLHSLVNEAYALVAIAAERTLGLGVYREQLSGAIELAERRIVEMETGQGKSLTATMPLFLHALQGSGAHLATTNDYLARRDADLMRPLYEMLAMSVGHIAEGMDDDTRRNHYACDITYGAATEFGFDFLRDRMKRRASGESGLSHPVVMRDLHYVVVDEADAVLIDEANLPMVIGAPGRVSDHKKRLYRWAEQIAPAAQERLHYSYNLRTRQVELTKHGRAWVRTRMPGLQLQNASILEAYQRVETAITVHRDFHRDQQYILRDGEIVLINESTGRLGEGRQWQDGIQQAIQAREQLEITAPQAHAAKITIQSLFLTYRHRAGMTGTAVAASNEFRRVYKMPVVRIPPHQPTRRRKLRTRYYHTEAKKWSAICQEIQRMQARGRPVLVGTRSVEKSHMLSNQLALAGVTHRVLNAREHAAEAEIIATAGDRGNVIVATGMAGRGTDIKLSEEVRQLGGLHVIMTELHDSPRMDSQLFGRCARQGDPGTHRQFLSPDDEILALGFGIQKATRMQAQRVLKPQVLRQAQKSLERRRKGNRFATLYQEKRKMRSIWEMGRDPLLDTV